MQKPQHVPVLVEEVIRYIDLRPNQNIVDATVGGGSLAANMLKATAPNGKLLGLDLDQDALDISTQTLEPFSNRVILHHANFAALQEVLEQFPDLQPVSAIVADLGISSIELDTGQRGFSFQQDAPLDMRFDQSKEETAADIIQTYSEEDLQQIFSEYGEERLAKRIASEIVKQRKETPPRRGKIL